MNVSEAVASRRSVRSFLSDAVSREVLERVLDKARRSPSGGNTQPWHAIIATGEPLARLHAAVGEMLPQGPAGFAPEYDIYPTQLDGAYETRRRAVAEAMYTAMDIARDDKIGRGRHFAENFRGFGAPVLLLVHTPRYMGPPQWADIGMWLQTIMLLLREEGLDSCAQEAWAIYSRQVRATFAIPDDHIFFCGMAIGYRDPDAPVNRFDVPRAPLEETVSFAGFAD